MFGTTIIVVAMAITHYNHCSIVCALLIGRWKSIAISGGLNLLKRIQFLRALILV